MTFRKNALLFYQTELCYGMFAIGSLALIPALGLAFSLTHTVLFIVLVLVNPKLHNEFITINETGISCKKIDREIWAYSWDSVSELRKSARFLLPSMDIIVYNHLGTPEQYARPNHYFQLGKAAKLAINRYATIRGQGGQRDGFREP